MRRFEVDDVIVDQLTGELEKAISGNSPKAKKRDDRSTKNKAPRRNVRSKTSRSNADLEVASEVALDTRGAKEPSDGSQNDKKRSKLKILITKYRINKGGANDRKNLGQILSLIHISEPTRPY